MSELLFLISSTTLPCGVEMFTRCLFDAWIEMGASAHMLPLGTAARLHRGKVLVLNLPMVAWKKKLFAPFLALFWTKLQGGRTLAILHEWKDLAWQRRAFFSLYLLLADMVMFSSPTVAEQFATRSFRLRDPRNAGILPIPPNLELPPEIKETELAKLVREKARGHIVLGQFGSIYPKKNSTFVLEVAAELKRRGHKPFILFAGSFIKDSDRTEELFHEKLRALGLEERTIVSGYLETAADVFAVLRCMDALVYEFDEGLTSRRSSVLAGLQSGSPVIVNAPSRADEFDHHPVFKYALNEGMLHMVRNKADVSEYADAVEAVIGRRHATVDLFRPGWRDAACALSSRLEKALGHAPQAAHAALTSPA